MRFQWTSVDQLPEYLDPTIGYGRWSWACLSSRYGFGFMVLVGPISSMPGYPNMWILHVIGLWTIYLDWKDKLGLFTRVSEGPGPRNCVWALFAMFGNWLLISVHSSQFDGIWPWQLWWWFGATVIDPLIDQAWVCNTLVGFSSGPVAGLLINRQKKALFSVRNSLQYDEGPLLDWSL